MKIQQKLTQRDILPSTLTDIAVISQKSPTLRNLKLQRAQSLIPRICSQWTIQIVLPTLCKSSMRSLHSRPKLKKGKIFAETKMWRSGTKWSPSSKIRKCINMRRPTAYCLPTSSNYCEKNRWRWHWRWTDCRGAKQMPTGERDCIWKNSKGWQTRTPRCTSSRENLWGSRRRSLSWSPERPIWQLPNPRPW